MNDKINRLIDQIKKCLVEMYGEKIKRVLLYGSYVRGEVTKDSDVDLLVVVDESLKPFEVRESLSDLLFDILLEEDELISVIVIHESFYENYKSPFMLNVKREGIVT